MLLDKLARRSLGEGGRTRVSAVTILVGLVMLLVPALAFMQYQWLGQLSTAERERMQRTLRTAAQQFATDFDTELSRTLVSLQINGEVVRDQNWGAYAQRYSQWASTAGDPRIVRDVLLVDTLPGTPLPAIGGSDVIPVERLRLRRWNTQTVTFDDMAWPAELRRLRDSLAARFIGFQVQRTSGRASDGAMSFTFNDDTMLVSPVTLFELPADHRGPPRISVLGFTIVRLEPALMRDTMLSSLTAKHFNSGDEEVNYRLAVVRNDETKSVVWESEPGVAAAVTASPDVTQSFNGARPEQMIVFARNMRGVSFPPPPPPPPAPAPRDRAHDEKQIVVQMIQEEARDGSKARVIARGTQPFAAFEGRWTLMAKHRAGSLEAAVAGVRTRNLAISSSVLILLTIAVGLIAVSARRAQDLARQQMEFVAAVSHELRTPVSVIGAAAGNLADGVVGDPQRVRKYGETIQGEARRLAETVERVLQLAGIAAGRAAAAQVPVTPADLVNESLAACRHEIDAAGFNVEVNVADGLPNVAGDVVALKSALQNLISNAVKYGGDARWLRVSASKTGPQTGPPQTVVQYRGYHRNSDLVVFAVEDRGMGIGAEDRKHIFEPFYRGREAVAQQIQGSGLGLNLVMRIAEAHGGRVTVLSEAGKGSTFTIALPAVHDHFVRRLHGVEPNLQADPTT
jgi:two-component system sensor histidine kinase SenX3